MGKKILLQFRNTLLLRHIQRSVTCMISGPRREVDENCDLLYEGLISCSHRSIRKYHYQLRTNPAQHSSSSVTYYHEMYLWHVRHNKTKGITVIYVKWPYTLMIGASKGVT